MDAIAVLDKMTELLTLGWCSKAEARDAHGLRVDCFDPTACSWCLLGAADRACGAHRDAGSIAREALRRVLPTEFHRNLYRWNDQQGSQRGALNLVQAARRELVQALKQGVSWAQPSQQIQSTGALSSIVEVLERHGLADLCGEVRAADPWSIVGLVREASEGGVPGATHALEGLVRLEHTHTTGGV